MTDDNVDDACALRVLPLQEAHAEPVAESLALAATLPTIGWPRLVYDGSILVAFVMAFRGVAWPLDAAGVTRSGIWRLLVDGTHQRKGYGRFAVEAVCAELRKSGEDACYATWQAGPDGPEGFYLGLGFLLTGEIRGRQLVARRNL